MTEIYMFLPTILVWLTSSLLSEKKNKKITFTLELCKHTHWRIWLVATDNWNKATTECSINLPTLCKWQLVDTHDRVYVYSLVDQTSTGCARSQAHGNRCEYNSMTRARMFAELTRLPVAVTWLYMCIMLCSFCRNVTDWDSLRRIPSQFETQSQHQVTPGYHYAGLKDTSLCPCVGSTHTVLNGLPTEHT